MHRPRLVIFQSKLYERPLQGMAHDGKRDFASSHFKVVRPWLFNFHAELESTAVPSYRHRLTDDLGPYVHHSPQPPNPMMQLENPTLK